MENLNPAVYDAVMQTVKFAALFRYVKQKHPEAWQAFLAQVKKIELTSINVPTVPTPSVWEKSRDEQWKAALWELLVDKSRQ
jgi:hypothetical protein